MYSKIIVLATFVAIAAAQYGGYYGHEQNHVDHYAPPHYEFKYGVEDSHTGDKKSHHEIREGDVTQGEYSLVEPDGTVRTVKYAVDKHSGFNAQVIRSGHAQHPANAPVYHAPVSVHHAPIAVHHAPIAIAHSPVAVHHTPIVARLSHGHATSYSNVAQRSHVQHNQHRYY